MTVLNEKGIPTPLAWTMLRAPRSRMDILSDNELEDLVSSSRLVTKYNKEIDRESAYEILEEKIAEFEEEERQEELRKQKEEEEKERERSTRSRSRGRREKSTLERVVNSSAGRTVVRELTRGILGVLGLGGRSRRKSSRRRKKKPGWW